jgi:ornithine--oxo-acid transaminase
MERGVLCKETHDQVIRLAPPLIVEKDDLDWAISQFKAVLE